MRSTFPMRVAKIGYIIMSSMLCLLGIILIIAPDFSISLLGILCGSILVVFGVIRLVGYFSKDLFRLAFQYDLVFGILMLVIGSVVLVRPDGVLNFVCIALGISILADALFKIQIAMESKRFGIKEWWLIFDTAIIAGIFGLILIFRPAEGSSLLTVLFGVALLSEGILNMSTAFTTVKIIRNQMPDDIDSYYKERED
ncbi:MAG: DUF308 domain-containing protein [Clostridiales bacterium]|jgi:uncharacterized membrane protein HdeD (DUF308 family)|nr:DUF308 domain-containing protein [Clostridiales bacterium]